MTQNNLELMRTLDDSWNAQNWETFKKRHSVDTTVFWPGQAEPTSCDRIILNRNLALTGGIYQNLIAPEAKLSRTLPSLHFC